MRNFYFFLISFFSMLPAFSQINQKGDLQVWLHPVYSHPLTSKLTWRIEQESRWGNDASELYHVFVESFLRYSRAEWIDVALGYRQSWIRDAEPKKWRHVYIPMFEFILKAKTHGWEVANRHRIQYNISPRDFPDVTYRNRLRITTPLRMGPLTPFTFNEVFWRERIESFSENRFAVGATLDMRKHMKMDLYYMLRSIRIDEEWRNMNVLNLFFYLTY